jgi:hypothetical protein
LSFQNGLDVKELAPLFKVNCVSGWHIYLVDGHIPGAGRE